MSMADEQQEKKVFTLLQVTTSIQKALAERYKSTYWIQAEMNKLNYYSHSGHCYPELLEKKNGKVLAQIKSNLWASDYQRINQRFLQVLKEPLKDGIKILFEASVTFDPVYGLALRIHDIDPSYTLGDLEREKAVTLERLTADGLINLNRKLALPVLPKRIAIVSVDTSKGYADFIKVLEENSWGYTFEHMLFPALLQGEKAIESIMGQLNRIRKVTRHFDVVAIIRGGGGDIGLSCYNDYKLAKMVAEFPLPVITGIGHATNETVVEMVAHRNAITPTKIAEFLIQQFHNFSVPVREAEQLIRDWPLQLLRQETGYVNQASRLFASVTRNVLQENQAAVQEQINTFLQGTRQRFRAEDQLRRLQLMSVRRQVPVLLSENGRQLSGLMRDLRKDADQRLAMRGEQLKTCLSTLKSVTYQRHKEQLHAMSLIEASIRHLDPKNVLNRGYSITLVNGKALTSVDEVRIGDIIQTVLVDGSVESSVDQISKTSI